MAATCTPPASGLAMQKYALRALKANSITKIRLDQLRKDSHRQTCERE